MTVLERTFRDLKFRLPSSKVKSLAITGETIDAPLKALQAALGKSGKRQQA